MTCRETDNERFALEDGGPKWGVLIFAPVPLSFMVAPLFYSSFWQNSLPSIVGWYILWSAPIALSVMSNAILARKFSAFEVSNHAITASRTWGQNVTVPWSSVSRVTFRNQSTDKNISSRIQIVSEEFGVIEIPESTTKYDRLARIIRERAPESILVEE